MEKEKLIWPDYEKCIVNIPNSILKKFGVEPVGKSLPDVDKLLKKDYKNIVVLLLDGMGIEILKKHLNEKGTFRSNINSSCKSVFLSTTVAATTSIMTGLQPCEHAWLGWDCYYPQIDKNVTVFLNTVQNTEEAAADYHVASTYNPYENIVDMINNAGGQAYMCATFLPPHPRFIEELCDQISNRCKLPGNKYIYAYFNQPDGLLHKYGCNSKEVHEALLHIEECVSQMASELEDTLILITADHGHIDTDYAVLQDYPKLMDCLVRMPSLEPRVLNFFVKEGKNKIFEEEFNKEFGDNFILMPMDEAIEKNLFGTGKHHENFRGMLGDYLAIATGNLSIFFNDERWLSMHGSLTPDEMYVPIIAIG